MGDAFLYEVYQGKNEWWRYAIAVIVIIFMAFIGLTCYGQLPWEPFGKLLLTSGFIGLLGFISMAIAWRSFE